jgi:replicative DNA helicase
LRDLIAEVEADAREAHEARKTGQPRGPLTGLKRLDDKIGGALPKDALTMVLGNTGTGKTALCGQIASDCRCPAVYVTTEMAPAELLRRHTARVTTTFLGRFKSGEMLPEEVANFMRRTVETLPHLSIVDATTAYASVAYLRDVLDVAKGNAKDAVLVLDSLHTWARGANIGASEYDTLNAHLTALGRLAKQSKCAIVVICEQSRAAMESGGVNSGAGSRFIEYSADLILDLKAGKHEEGSGERPVTLTLAKNRHGAADATVKLTFNGALQRFKEADK